MTLSWSNMAAQWGCDPVYDKPPRNPGDGYLFYNFSVEGYDKPFLRKFIPAIERTLAAVQQDPDKHEAGSAKELEGLKRECLSRLAAKPKRRVKKT